MFDSRCEVMVLTGFCKQQAFRERDDLSERKTCYYHRKLELGLMEPTKEEYALD